MSPKQKSCTKQAVIYLRVSTREQAERGGEAEGFSIPAQREACRRKATSLDAEVVETFIDAGESAKSTDREDLQNMLTFLAENRLDYVIVHKVDRLARNRADDVMINLAIKGAGAQLISCTENIDDTPSGMLMHGIMSSIAEFYSANLATEAKKGMREKAKRGGTPGRAPFGYRNIVFKDAQGREVRTVEVDEERAEAVRWMFDAYATSNWTTKQIATEFAKRGIQSRPTPNRPSRPITPAQVADMLGKRYYLGYVTFGGVEYQGRHVPLVDEITWQTVQDIKRARNVKKERPAQHPHYLKSLVRCGECGRSLGIECVRNSQGIIYPYFYCPGRREDKTSCTQRALMVTEVERLVEEHWRTVCLTPELRDQLADDMRQHIKAVLPNRDKAATRAKKRVADLENQRAKLLAAHYAEAVPLDLLKTEQTRIGAELAVAKQSLDQATRAVHRLEAHVDAALALLTNAHTQYRAADHTGRQLMNQAVFEAIWIGDDDIDAAQVRPGMAELISADLSEQLARDATEAVGPARSKRGRPADTRRTVIDSVGSERSHRSPLDSLADVETDQPTATHRTASSLTDHLAAMLTEPSQAVRRQRFPWSERIPGHEKNLRRGHRVGGSNEAVLVGVTGLEPATSRPPGVRATNCAKPRRSVILPQNSLCPIISILYNE